MSLPLKESKCDNVHFLTAIEIFILLDFAVLKSKIAERDSQISNLKEELRTVRQGEYKWPVKNNMASLTECKRASQIEADFFLSFSHFFGFQ